MDAWLGIPLVLAAMAGALRLYAWCQMRYWYSPRSIEDWMPCEARREKIEPVITGSRGRRHDSEVFRVSGNMHATQNLNTRARRV